MTSRRACLRIAALCFAVSPIALCGLARAEPAADDWQRPDEIITAEGLSKLVSDNQRWAIAAGVGFLLVLLAVVYLVPIIRRPRWQILAFALLPACVAFATMVGLSRPIEPGVEKLPSEEMTNVIRNELAPASDKALADQMLRWQDKLQGRSFLIDLSSMPVSATFVASAALVLLCWFMSHHRVLRSN
ncbi:MAG: hypothetical protein E6J90_01570 [Deltaproteobacteria bacterium]|nr:MAG: hypothetical protein E6J91_04950 [Deltaproteobacteria bacterium]TMQ27852.1 MAG: hypothetical protein E6J90_01570 [Deltaproteobacteria bacterium]